MISFSECKMCRKQKQRNNAADKEWRTGFLIREHPIAILQSSNSPSLE